MTEVITNTGKIAVLFNGTVLSNCTNDSDCPSQATCMINATWSAFPSMCTCSTQISRSGESCQNLNPGGQALFALCFIGFCIATCASSILLYGAYRMIKARVTVTFSALQTTLFFLNVGAISVQIYLLLAMIDQFIPFQLTHRGDGVIRLSSPTFVASNVFLAATFWFETLGLLNISLVWVDIASASKSMTVRIQNNVQRFRYVLAVYYFFFGGAVILLVILDRANSMVFVVIPPIAFLLTTYVWGYFRMSQAASVVTSSSSEKKDGSGLQSASAKARNVDLKRALRRMAHTSAALVFCGGFGVLFLIVQGSISIVNSNTPTSPTTVILNRLSWICFTSCLLVGALYMHPLVMNNISKDHPHRVVDSTNEENGKSIAPSSANAMPLAISQATLNDAPSIPAKKKSVTAGMSADPSAGLDAILKDDTSELRDRFTEFVRSKYASEPLNLYDACKQYRTMALKPVSKAELTAYGRNIIGKYIVDNAPNAVDMAHSLRSELLQVNISGDFTSTTFEKARNMAFDLLKVNFYHQFHQALEDEERGH